ncbi:leucine-rich repeat-containing protein 52 isoform X2 [Nilaparvata lugens]|uniref:leucine-rich repeat-containing protein 52 isoform X2 n=1 Tax=Nilaparvata lugens TaxID=108931 RepID=UPI00193E4F31|nr:leucine-rich repeat-containing protein 52 isoform X2 [Nilaparvata lugens]
MLCVLTVQQITNKMAVLNGTQIIRLYAMVLLDSTMNYREHIITKTEISHHFLFLVTLDVHNSNITTIDHNEAADGTLPYLQVLNVSHNELQRIMLPHLHALERLDLRHNRFTDLRAYDLVNLPNLRSILLAGNPWECEQTMLWLLEPQKYSLSIQQTNERMTCAGKSIMVNKYWEF